MKTVFFFVVTLFIFQSVECGRLQLDISASSAILINADSGSVLYEKNADAKSYPASLTKIATCLYALKANSKDINRAVTCTPECLRLMKKSTKIARSYSCPSFYLEPDGTHYMIQPKEKIAFKDLLFGLMLSSGNDAANCIAHEIGGNIPNFMQGMNYYLKELGCKNTQFNNPHGLHHPGHFSTARDIALITAEAIKVDLIKDIVSTKQHMRMATNLQPFKIVNTKNLLLKPGKYFYPGAIGMKTGYHSDAQHTFSGVVHKDGRTLIAVVLGCKDSANQCFQDVVRMFDAAFNEEKETRILFNSAENVFKRSVKGAKQSLEAKLLNNIEISYYPSEECDYTIELNWDYKEAPIGKGAILGSLNIYDKKRNAISSAALEAVDNVQLTKFAYIKNCATKMFRFDKGFAIGAFFTIAVILLVSSLCLGCSKLILKGKKINK